MRGSLPVAETSLNVTGISATLETPENRVENSPLQIFELCDAIIPDWELTASGDCAVAARVVFCSMQCHQYSLRAYKYP